MNTGFVYYTRKLVDQGYLMCVLVIARKKPSGCVYVLVMRGSKFESEYGVEFLLKIQDSLVERREIRLVR